MVCKADCNPCRSGNSRKQSCHRTSLGGMVYKAQCLTCKEKGVTDGWEIISLYHGRSQRCLYTRQGEHFAGLTGEKEENALWKHKELFHPGEECKFAFEVEKLFKDAISHQIYEGICINHSPSTPGYLMNSKAEYEQGQVARLVVARGL